MKNKEEIRMIAGHPDATPAIYIDWFEKGYYAGILDYSEPELQRLYEWVMDENRKPAQTFFTAGWLRNVAKEIEYRLMTEQDYIKWQEWFTNYHINRIYQLAHSNKRFESGTDTIGFIYISQLEEILKEVFKPDKPTK
jgi:hypothetical protein